MKKNKRVKRWKNRGLLVNIIRIILLLCVGILYFIYFIFKNINTLAGNIFLKLPRIARVGIVYTTVFSLFACTYIAKNTPVLLEVARPTHYLKIDKINIKTVQAKTKPKPKIVKPKVTTPMQVITASSSDYQNYAHDLCINTYGWTENDFTSLVKLWNRESGWKANAHNPSSGAHGIPQSLPASKMASEGADYYTNGYTQIRWGLKYIASRYGNPSNAWAHSESHGWY